MWTFFNFTELKTTKLFTEFLESEKSGGIVLLAATLLSFAIANSAFGSSYVSFWESKVGDQSLTHWINDGLMTIFFLLIGLELEREIYIGELSDMKNAALPIFGALGGMLLPAGIFLFMNYGTPSQAGTGIPMATDIAFAVGIMSLLGNRVPTSLKIFLTALAVIDDLGAIIVIAVFYTKTLSMSFLAAAVSIWILLFVLNRLKIQNFLPYLIGGIAMWYCMSRSGVHPTITGVILAFVIPFGNGDEKSTSHRLQHWLHKPVAFFVLPAFALANTCIAIDSSRSVIGESVGAGIFGGLVIGKPLGIWLFSFVAAKLKLCKLPGELRWRNIFGAGILGGIGFTMSIFITMLAFGDSGLIDASKIAILVASAVSAIFGLAFLSLTLKKNPEPSPDIF